MTLNQRKAFEFWLESSEQDIQTARDLLKLKHNHWALFIYHLAIEKLLKALVIKVGITPPYTHDLKRLVTIAKIKSNNDFNAWLKEISTYNLEARYPAEKEEIYQWLQHQLY